MLDCPVTLEAYFRCQSRGFGPHNRPDDGL